MKNQILETIAAKGETSVHDIIDALSKKGHCPFQTSKCLEHMMDKKELRLHGSKLKVR